MYRVIAATSGCLLLSAGASASFINAKFEGVSPGQGVSFSTNGGGSFMNTTAGVFNWTQTGGDYDMPGPTSSFMTFCIEVTQYISPGSSYTYNIVPIETAPNTAPMGVATAGMLSELFGRYYTTGFSATQAAAMQVAIWEIVNDADLSVTSGSFRIGTSAGFVTTAQGMLDSLDGTGPTRTLAAISNGSSQDQVFVVPSPGVFALAGLVGLCGLRRRRS
jgi:hypothetical protein